MQARPKPLFLQRVMIEAAFGALAVAAPGPLEARLSVRAGTEQPEPQYTWPRLDSDLAPIAAAADGK
mgnify:CR=1 FL=1